ncbi:MAG TPA: hypothetical protein VEA80_15560 [Vitreimonas sp.]|uniref:hypothetical protein n=1 Tax=Vitreimonas sp. TaxID=3069702 RepID=UPI002D5C27C9|nr:hypothetical protein [Vitreimonas sp.]HYD88891.1 hypothetical protein [Vitreimonas sp.]
MPQTKTSKARTYGVLTLGLAATLVVATGRPDSEAAAWIAEAGLPTMVLYLAPIAVSFAALLVGAWLAPGKPVLVRMLIYAGLGAVAGFTMAMCLNLFAAAPGLIETVTGPLAEPGLIEILLWAMTGICAVLGLMVLALALIGGSAVVAINVEEVDAEALDVLKAERVTFGWSAAGMLGLAFSVGALAVARQAGEGAAFGPVIGSIVGFVLYNIASIVLWRGFDELERRHVVDAFSISAILVTMGAFIWAVVDASVGAPPIDAAALYLTLIFVQIIATFYVTAKMMGESSVFGKLA